MNQQHNETNWQPAYANWIEQGTAPSTRRAYDRDENYFWQWAHVHIDNTLTYPVSSNTVLQFCLYHLDHQSPTPLSDSFNSSVTLLSLSGVSSDE